MTDLKLVSDGAVDQAAPDLLSLSQDIWNRPELGFEETYAHERLTKFLRDRGFSVECGYKGIKTAFRARYGPEDGSPHVVIFCEYDALPGIGHGCGHNLIAQVGVAAGLGVRAAMEAAGKDIGQVTVLGSPDEEGSGGKNYLILAGALEGVDAAIMSHPTGFEIPRMETLAIREFRVRYKGLASHASASPWKGVNALDAAVLCYQNLSCLRQQLKPNWQIHGIISNGGAKPNIIPELTELSYNIRASTAKGLLQLWAKVVPCIEAAAQATGCTVEIIEEDVPYLDVLQNESLIRTYLDELREVDEGVKACIPVPPPGGSTDMGNVSYLVPAIHPGFKIAPGVANHTREFTTASGDVGAQTRTQTEGKVLARLALDLFLNPELMSQDGFPPLFRLVLPHQDDLPKTPSKPFHPVTLY